MAEVTSDKAVFFGPNMWSYYGDSSCWKKILMLTKEDFNEEAAYSICRYGLIRFAVPIP